MSRFSKLKNRNEQTEAFKRENFLTTQEEIVNQKVGNRMADRYNLVSENFRGFSGAFTHLETLAHVDEKVDSLFYAVRSVLQSKSKIKTVLFARDERAKSEDFIETYCTIDRKKGPGYTRLLNNRESMAAETAKSFVADEGLLAIEADYEEGCMVYFKKKDRTDPVWKEQKVVGEKVEKVKKTVKEGKKEKEIEEEQTVTLTAPWNAYAKLSYSLR